MKQIYYQRWPLATLFWLLLLTSTLWAQQLPPGFSASELQTGYTQPVGALFSNDGRQLFVWEKSGRLWVSNWNGTTYVKQPTPVLDISPEVGNWRDFGLLSVCLDPDFSNNGLLYLLYVVDRHHLLYYGTPQYNPTANEYNQATISRVTRYQINNTGGTLAANENSRRVLIGESKTTGIPLTYESHAVGTLLFGRDGTLLVSTGDNASYSSIDVGSAQETYFRTALDDGIMRPEENVGCFRSQMVTSLCGKILRIDPATGNGVASNPFYEGANVRSARSRVWALGLRNPCRMSLQPMTGSLLSSEGNPGTLVVGDVGSVYREELNVISQAGLNLGWPVYEGLTPAAYYSSSSVRNLDEPGQPTFVSLCRQPTGPLNEPNPASRRFIHARSILDWQHGTAEARVPAFNGTTAITKTVGAAGGPTGTAFMGNCAMGGLLYTGTQFPAAYQNSYFFADFGQNWIKNAVVDPNGTYQVQQIREFAPTGLSQGIVDLKMNPRDGSLIYVNIYSGQLRRISYGGNQPPVASVSADVLMGTSPLRVSFSSDGSADPEGHPLSYRWDFGDGTTSTEANPQHVFTADATRGFTVNLTVTDPGQLSSSKQVVISVNNTAPVVQITSPVDNSLYPMDRTSSYQLQALVQDNDPTNLRYDWQVSLYHNEHHHDEPIIQAVSPTIELTPLGCSLAETYHYEIKLTVTDNGGLTATTYTHLYPDCGSLRANVSAVTATAASRAVRVDWQNPLTTIDEVMVVARPLEDISALPSGTGYTADANFTGSGSSLGGGKVVYRGLGTSVTVTNLTSPTLYSFRLFTRWGNTWSQGVAVTGTPLNRPPVVASAVSSLTALRNQSFQMDLPTNTFTDPDGDVLTYSLTGLPAGLSYSGTRISGTPTTVGVFPLQWKATDGGGLSVTTPIGLTVIQPNRAPLVASAVSSLTALRNQAFQVDLPTSTFTDPDGDALTYSLTGLPAGLSYSGTRISGTPTTVGAFTLQWKATDGGGLSVTSPIGLTVIQPNQAPLVASNVSGLTALRNQAFQADLPTSTFTDPDGDGLTYSMTGLPAGLSYSGTRISGTPTTVGAFTLQWKATDGGGLSVTTPIGLTVVQPNRAPVVASAVSSLTALRNQAFQVDLPTSTFTDPDGDALTYSLTGLPAGLSYSGTRISGTPTTVGAFTLQWKATDPGGLSVTTPIGLTVIQPNRAPLVASAVSSLTALRNQAFQVDLPTSTFTDPDGDALTYALTGLPAGLSYSGTRISGTPTTVGAFTLQWKATDGGGLSVTTPIGLTVVQPNQAPLVASNVSGLTALRNQAFQADLPTSTFTDPDGDALTYALTGLPAGLSYSGTRISGTPTTVGAFTLQWKATDGGGLSVTTPIGLTVIQPNRAPLVASAVSSLTALRNQAFQVDLPTSTFTDPDGDALTYSLTGLPAGLSYSGTRISGTPTTVGAFTLQWKATDGGGLSVTSPIGLTVIQPNQAPLVASNVSGLTALRNQAFQADLPTSTFTDPDGDGLTYSMTGLPAGLSYSGTRISGTPTTVGAFTLQWKATDGGGLSVTTPIGLTVVQPNQAPVVASNVSGLTALRNQAFQADLPTSTFTDPDGDALTYSLTGLPAGLSYNGTRISGTPTTVGAFTLQWKATDGGGLSVTTPIGLTVTQPNQAPLRLIPPVFNCTTGQLTLGTTGGNGQPVEYHIPSVTTGWTTSTLITIDAKAFKKKKLSIKARQKKEASSAYDQAADIDNYELPACPGARIAIAEETRPELQVMLLANPIRNNQVSVEVRGAQGQQLQYELLDLRGQAISITQIEQAEAADHQLLGIGTQPAGLFFLRVSTNQQTKTVKVLKVD